VSVARWALAVITVCLMLAPTGAWAGDKFKVLHAFGKGSDGASPFDSVALDAKGNLYGTTRGGGAYGYGTVFMLRRVASGKWAASILYAFCAEPRCADGALPTVGVALDAIGNLYGSSNTTTFQMAPDSTMPKGWSFQVIYDSGSDGLVLDKAGNLYGAWGPGKYGKGDIFELDPGTDGWTEIYLHSFCRVNTCLDGDEPHSVLAWDTAGNLYGTTLGGGTGKGGVAFELEHVSGGWKEHVLHNFPASSGDGYPTSSGLTLDSAGNLYGTTLQGGSKGCEGGGCGTVYQLKRGTDGHWKETILYNFPTLKDGAGPSGGLAIGKAGNLYGVSGGGTGPCGGGGCGLVFKMTPPKSGSGKWTYTVLHRFTGPDGALPVAGPTLDDKGNLFGTTSTGGANGSGVVYEITP
jgi:uncharacterized repeat protein (TIGR03803 family)